MIQITLTDDQLAAIDAQRAAGAPPVIVTPTPTPSPATTPAGVHIVDIPFSSPSGLQQIRIPAGVTLAFRFTVPAGYPVSTNSGRFSAMPTGGSDYLNRVMCISDAPGDFSGPMAAASLVLGMAQTVYFTVGLPAMIGVLFKRPDPHTPLLMPGKVYFGNVKQEDPTASCSINHSLYTP